MFKTTRILFFIVVSTIFLNCTRNVESNSNVTLSFPNLNQVGTLSCTTCLKYIIVKVEGEGFDKILTKVSAENIQDTSEVSGEFTYSIPPGMNRKFKAVAIYVLNGTHILASGETTVDLPDTSFKEVSIDMIGQGEVHGGSLVGRYITGVSNGNDVGPTGTVDVILNANADSDFDMLIQQVPILNGWFDFMASENLNMTYKIADQNLILFQNTSLNTLIPLTGGTLQNHIARVVRPKEYYRNNGSIPWEFNDEKHDIVYGFFGSAAFLTNKYVCLEYVSGPTNFSNVSSISSGATPMTYSHSSASANFYGIGGLNSTQTPCINSTTFDRFTSTHISINKSQLDGKGNDTAKAFGNAFTYTVSSGDITKANYSAGTFSLKTLPGLFSPIVGDDKFQDILLFSKPNAAHGGLDDIRCNVDWLTSNGFTNLSATTSLASSGDYTTFSITGSISSSDGTIACPTKNDQLVDAGGFYLGGLYFSHLTGPTSGFITNSSGPLALTITNTGSQNTTISPTLTVVSEINYLGGSYPGSGGTCSSVLAAGTSCVIKMTYSGAVSVDATLSLSYNGGVHSVQIHGEP
jgi:hypothetical protein